MSKLSLSVVLLALLASGLQAQTADTGQRAGISLVFHIVYNTDEQNISDAQIYSQIISLKADFLRENADTVNTLDIFKSVAASANITFYPALNDPQGGLTGGITRTQTSHGTFANSDIHYTSKGGSDPWPTDRYLNIWVCDLPEGTFGFTAQNNSVENGVVIDYRYLGNMGTVSAPFDKGRTLTHELGHWFGLKHPWGAAGGCLDDDGLADTPQQEGPSSGCDLDRVSCGHLNMVQNFMDTSDDGCMNLFTRDQVALMRKNLFADHNELIQEIIVLGVEPAMQKPPIWYRTGDHQYHITTPDPVTTISIYSLLGQEMHRQEFPDPVNDATVDVGSVKGLFVLMVNSARGRKAIRIVID